MRSTKYSLLMITCLLFACSSRAGQDIVSQSKAPPPNTDQSSSRQLKRLPALYTSSQSIWGGFKLSDSYTEVGNWGGYPLHTTFVDPSSLSSFTPPCRSIIGYCVADHRYSFRSPFSPEFNTTIDTSYRYGTTQFGALPVHHGVEILNPTGTPVLAVADGTVAFAGDDSQKVYGPWKNFYGNLVILLHQVPDFTEPVYTLYAHLEMVSVQAGQKVSAGEMIGEVGTTGRAIGSHLHFEVRVGVNTYGGTRNPELWLFPHRDENEQLLGTMVGRISNPQGQPIHLMINAHYYPEFEETSIKTFRIETYAPDEIPIRSHQAFQENFVMNDLLPGYYRIVLNNAGRWTENWVKVESGRLSYVTIVVR